MHGPGFGHEMRQHVDRKPFVSSSVLCGLLVVSSWSSRGLPGSAGGPESSSLVVSWWSPGSFPVVSWSPGAVRSLFLRDLPLLKQRGLQERQNVFPPCLACFSVCRSHCHHASRLCLVVSRLVMSPRNKHGLEMLRVTHPVSLHQRSSDLVRGRKPSVHLPTCDSRAASWSFAQASLGALLRGKRCRNGVWRACRSHTCTFLCWSFAQASVGALFRGKRCRNGVWRACRSHTCTFLRWSFAQASLGALLRGKRCRNGVWRACEGAHMHHGQARQSIAATKCLDARMLV